MKKSTKNPNKLIALLLVAFSLVGVSLIGRGGAAGSASISFSSTSSTVKKGSTVSVIVNEDTGAELAYVIQAFVSYDQSKLEFINIDTSSSAFDLPVASSGGSGSVEISRGVSGGNSLTGSNRLAIINFRVLGDSGTTALSLGSGTDMRGDLNIWNGLPSTYTLSLTPADVVQPAPAVPPAVQPVTPTKQKTQSAVITSPTSVVVQPGDINIPDEIQVPTVNRLSETDGQLVSIQVFNALGLGVKDVEVRIGDKVDKTDELGIASFSGIPEGTYKVRAGGEEIEITVVAGDYSTFQNYEIRQGKLFPIWLKWLLIAMASVVVAVGAGMIALPRLRSRRQLILRTTKPETGGLFHDPRHETIIDTKGHEVPKNIESPGSVHIPQPSEVIEPTKPRDDN